MLALERRRILLDLVRRKGTMRISDLERRLKVGRMTIYRDVDVLVSEGKVDKVHGGVVAREDGMGAADGLARPLVERLAVAAPAKRAIAQHLVGLLAGARTALVDNSSTVFGLAEVLLPRPEHELFLLTGSVSLFLELQRRRLEGVRIALHGGEPHPRTGTLVGPFALSSLADARFDVAIMSCLGVIPQEDAVFVTNPDEVELKRAYMRAARRAVLAFDTSKLGLSGPYRLAKLSDFAAVATEAGEQAPARAIARNRVASDGRSR